MVKESAGGTVLIACKMLQHELNKAIAENGCPYPIIWIDSEYHTDPNGLRAKLQEEIDRLEEVDTILLAYGCCGNGTVGLKATTGDLIIPRTEDCISMLMSQRGQAYVRPKATFFMTKGWLEGTHSMAREIEHAVKRYGPERAKKIFEQMFRHYKYLMLIDTKSYSIEECLAEVELLAQSLNLELTFAEGDVWFLRKLLSGSFAQDFSITPRGETVSQQDFACCDQDLPRQPY
ncbi:DUF1638 domain-containing protein [Desulfitobacterium hafniense]|uniref:DUF1638 domain-containing protein n=4 Tax=root TaxID=1 RepID=Q24TY5_DESHY|nr:DUF1638 domain-containing protein [Desulfitobacterium hafniense]EHL07058.1 hypothetical protein HMPREF0322_02216 [Desulfitobacterium hafniense DP7]KTE90092.1 hypothetical protein AT727_09190 [Desulfitobacterium hafniense]MEA5022519.1 DUF1638 domain-containing protein [Desulfitobacterium hafniense]CDX02819.1 Protein of unknown function (DUF1638) [Desulfitobacterium hafniense]BAE84507.1 hypothetical protein DSY2718 [Desulfitobacterium hafniense Y51]